MYCDLPMFTRCCMCMPLRRGVLTLGYIILAFNLLIVARESYHIHNNRRPIQSYQSIDLPDELTLTLDCIDIVLGVILIVGAHMQRLVCVKAYYYYSIATFVLDTVLWIVDFSLAGRRFAPYFFYTIPFVLCFKFIQIYLLLLIRSLIQKMAVSTDHKYENPLERIVYGEGVVEEYGVYTNITVELNGSEK